MKLLVLGGTLFLGRHIVQTALDRQHEVTLFNRGQTSPELFPDAEKLHGDRAGDLQALQGRRWDAVIDTCGYVPRLVHASATALKDAVAHYTFISSISVYADRSQPGLTEEAPICTLENPTTEVVGPKTYGPLKGLCEQAVNAVMPGRTCIVRPGLLVGPHDPTGRFTYWVQRLAAGGEVLAPGPPERPVQCLDVRDAAAWLLHLAEVRATGTFQVTGPLAPLSMEEFLTTCQQALHSDVHVTWVSEAFLLEHGVHPWTELPLWVPPHSRGTFTIDISKAQRTGLTCRPLADTIRATLQWATQDRPEDRGVSRLASGESTQTGLSQEREAVLLQHWHRQQ